MTVVIWLAVRELFRKNALKRKKCGFHLRAICWPVCGV